jgi:hypothetical protein
MKKKVKIGLSLLIGTVLIGGIVWISTAPYFGPDSTSNNFSFSDVPFDNNLEPLENVIRKNPVKCENSDDCKWRCCGKAVDYGYKCTNVNDISCHECPTKDDPNRPPILLPCMCVDHKCIGAYLIEKNLEFEFSRCKNCTEEIENTIREIKWDGNTLIVDAIVTRNACVDHLEGAYIIDGDIIKLDVLEKEEGRCWSLSSYKTTFKMKDLQKKDYKIQLVDSCRTISDEKIITVN